MSETITLRRLGPEDLDVLLNIEEGLFDNPVRPGQAKAFLNDPMHEMVLAFAGNKVVGMASGQILLHPDKPPALFVNELGVRDAYLRQGIAKRLCAKLFEIARKRGTQGIWLATEEDNAPARAVYRSLNARETQGIVVYDWEGAMDE